MTDPLQLKPLLGAWILQPEVAGADKGATIRFLVSDQELLGFWSDGNHQTPLSALTFSGEWLSFEITRESKTDRFEGRIQNDTLQGHFFGPTYWSAWSGRKQQGPAEPQR